MSGRAAPVACRLPPARLAHGGLPCRCWLQGADPTARDGENRTPLHHAVMRGHLAVVDLLLQRAGPALLLAKDVLGCTPVHLAAVQNQVCCVEAATAGCCGLAAGCSHSRLSPNLWLPPSGCLPAAPQVTLIIRLVEALLQDEGGRTPLHEVARRRCMQVRAAGAAALGVAVLLLRGSRAEAAVAAG